MIYSLIVILLGLGGAHCTWGGYYRGGGYQHRGAEHCRPPIQHGLVATPFKRKYNHGDVIEISCREGYELTNKRPNSTCRVFDVFGSHGVFMPAITPVTCRELPLCRPPYGFGVIVTPMKTTYEVGENITVSCKEGFVQPGGASTYTCELISHRYGGATFGVSGRRICREIRDCPVPLQEGLSIEPLKMMYKPGEEISLSCEEGYELAVSNTSTCEPTGHFNFERQDDEEYDEWQGHHYIFTTQACRKKAKCMLPDFPGMIVTPSKSSYMTGEEITISCEDDYELTTPNKSVCGYEEHGSGNMYDFFSFLDRMSGTGYFEPRLRSRTCMPKPKCYAPRDRGVIITPEKRSYKLGETIKVSCAEGYELIGEATRTCSRHEESDMIYRRMGYHYGYSYGHFVPEMYDICKKKEMCRPSIWRGVVLEPKKSMYDIGEKVTVSCMPGYNLKQVNESTCETSGRWSRHGRFSPNIDGDVCEKIPSCDKPSREGLILAPEKDYYEIGDKVSLSCEEGYEQRVAPTSTCMRRRSGKYGSFDPDIGREPCRKPTSCRAPSGANLTVTPEKESYAEGDEIELSCDEGYKRVAPRKMRCERSFYCRGHYERVTGCFHPSSPRVACIKKQKCKPPKGKNLMISPQKEEYEEGDMLTLSCEDGYELNLHYDTVACRTTRRVMGFNVGMISVRFTPSLPREICKKKATCSAPEVGEGVVITPAKDEYYVGDKIELSCEEGYELEGEDMSECMYRKRYIYPGHFMRKGTMFKPSVKKSSCKKLVVEEAETTKVPESTEEPETETSEPESTEEPEVETTEPESTEEPDMGDAGSAVEPDVDASGMETTEPTPPFSVDPTETDSGEQVILEEGEIERA